MELPELVSIVQALNDEECLYNKGEAFVLSQTGYQSFIKFNEHLLWSDDDDMREWNEEINDYEETVEDHCKRKFCEYVRLLTVVKNKWDKL